MTDQRAAAARNGALDAVSLVSDELSAEVNLLDADHGSSHAPAASVTALLQRRIPDVCSLLASHLRELPAEDITEVLDSCFVRPPFDDDRVKDTMPHLRDHLAAYTQSLARWKGWQHRLLELAWIDSRVALRWVTAWERPADDALAADVVGYVEDPKDFASPDGSFALFLRDATAVLGWLVDEYGHDRVRGVRLWILGADHKPVVRWLTPNELSPSA